MQTDLKIFKHLLQLNIFLHINEESFITTLSNIDAFNKNVCKLKSYNTYYWKYYRKKGLAT